jgi:hypothetical protein
MTLESLPDDLTIGELIKLVRSRKVKNIYMLPNFGTNETWVEVKKSEALIMLECSKVRDDLTAKDLSLYTSSFGSLSAYGMLYLG